MKAVLWSITLTAVIMFAGCKASMPTETGFLSDYSKLQKKTSSSMVYVNNQKLGTYSKFIVDPVQVRFYDKKDESKIPSEKLTFLQDTMHNSFVNELEKNGYQVVNEPGPGVARIRLALTDIKESTPALNVIPQTAIAGVGLGGASTEGEIVDSQTNEQVAASIESELGKRFKLADLSTYGDAEAVINAWAQRIVQRINEAHGR